MTKKRRKFILGFKFIIDKVKELLNLNYAFGNSIKIDENNSILTKEINEPTINSNKKTEVINLICQAEELNPDDVISLNDFSNDNYDFSSSVINIQLDVNITNYLLKIYEKKEISTENLVGIILAFCYPVIT